MSKIIAIIAVIVVCIAGVLAPTAHVPTEPEKIEPMPEVVDMTGIVTEVTDAYIMISNPEYNVVQVNVHPETIFEGAAPAVGDLIHVMYNGMVMRSLPAQINAQHIGCYVRTGAVVELTQEGFTLDDGMEIIQVNATDVPEGLEPGMQVKVYFNGAMTMSLPAQIGAELIVPAE